jgi:hypothetical protein
LSAEAAAELIGSQAPKVFDVWPENWPAVELFMRCQTQWRTDNGQRIGLINSELIGTGRLYRVKNLCRVMEDVQVIEVEILNQGAKG